MHYPQSLQTLIDALKRLPSVGPKTAQRMAFHLLEADRGSMAALAQALTAADSALRDCSRCRNFSESEECGLCSSPRRDQSLICVVESPADLVAIEQGGVYQGHYFVLHGRLSPLDGVGPDALGLDALDERLAEAFWPPAPLSKAKLRPTSWRKWPAVRARRSRVSPTACPWAASSSMWMPAPWRMLCEGGNRWSAMSRPR